VLTLFFSPHSTSVDNEAGRASGHHDVPLSAAGRQQANALGDQYAAIRLDELHAHARERRAPRR